MKTTDIDISETVRDSPIVADSPQRRLSMDGVVGLKAQSREPARHKEASVSHMTTHREALSQGGIEG